MGHNDAAGMGYMDAAEGDQPMVERNQLWSVTGGLFAVASAILRRGDACRRAHAGPLSVRIERLGRPSGLARRHPHGPRSLVRNGALPGVGEGPRSAGRHHHQVLRIGPARDTFVGSDLGLGLVGWLLDGLARRSDRVIRHGCASRCGGAGAFLFLGTIDGGTRPVGRTSYPLIWVTLVGS